MFKEISLNRLKSITILKTGVSFSSDLMLQLSTRGISFFIFDKYARSVSTLSGSHQHAVVKVRKYQLLFSDSPDCWKLCRTIVLGKIKNQLSLLKYLRKKSKDNDLISKLTITIDMITVTIHKLKDLDLEKHEKWRSILLGYEGSSANLYFGAIKDNHIMRNSFKKRIGRGGSDITNSMLNYGYAILSTYIWSALINSGLEVYSGVLHVERAGKPSLVLDMMEEYRAWVVDKSVFKLERKIKNHEKFTGKLKEALINEIHNMLIKKYSYHGRKISLESVIQRQAYKLSAHFMGKKTYTPYIFRW